MIPNKILALFKVFEACFLVTISPFLFFLNPVGLHNWVLKLGSEINDLIDKLNNE